MAYKGRALFIAEKPSVSNDIQKIYNTVKNDIELEIEFEAFAGHICQLAEPESYSESWGKPWKLEVLPMIPQQWNTVVGNPNIFNRIKSKIESGRYDYIINACDAGREGELIFCNAIEAMGNTLPVLRYWASEAAPNTVIKALKELKPDSEFENLRNAAKCRAEFDWLIGMNFTRASCLKSRMRIITGRVMTVVLAMISEREMEITEFKPEPFYEVVGSFTNKDSLTYDGLYYNTEEDDEKKQKDITRFKTKEEAEKIVSIVNGKTGIVSERKAVKTVSPAPPLYNISDLEKDAAKLYGYTPEQTLDLAQKLYEKKFLSYPRTESRHLSDNLSESVRQRLESVLPVNELSSIVTNVLNDTTGRIKSIMKNKSYVDNTKLTDHHAIIPTEVKVDLSSLSTQEANIYTMVAKKFVSIFMDPFIYETLKLVTTVDNDYTFKTSGKTILQEGWRALFSNKSKDVPLPAVSEKESVFVSNVTITEGKTTAPARYNYATILQAMQNAGRSLTDEELKFTMKDKGIGTGATRAGIIKKLEECNYIESSGKGKLKSLNPTSEGLKIYKLLKDYSFSSPSLTAEWEKKLVDMEDGVYDYNTFYYEMIEYISSTTASLIANLEEVKSSGRNIVGSCPCCQADIIEGKKSFFCVNTLNKKKKEEAESKGETFDGVICDFSFAKSIKGASITAKDAVDLLSKGKTKEKTFTWSNGSKEKTYLILTDNKIGFPKIEKTAIGSCPVCGEEIVEGKKSYFCKNVLQKASEDSDERKCYFSFGKVIKGANINRSQAEKLLKNKETDEIEFTWSSGSKSKSKLILKTETNENGQTKTVIGFPSFEQKEFSTCPGCGKPFKETSAYYMCSNYKKSCNLILSKEINGAKISKNDVAALLSGKEVKKMFTWKSGKSSEAYAKAEINNGRFKISYRWD